MNTDKSGQKEMHPHVASMNKFKLEGQEGRKAGRQEKEPSVHFFLPVFLPSLSKTTQVNDKWPRNRLGLISFHQRTQSLQSEETIAVLLAPKNLALLAAWRFKTLPCGSEFTAEPRRSRRKMDSET
jgi:hypothetical protein